MDEKKKKSIGIAGLIFILLQGIVSVWFVVSLFDIGVLPTKYMTIIIAALAVLFVITFATQKRHKGHAIGGKILSVVVSMILIVAGFYVSKLNNAFETVTGGSYKVDSMAVAVLKDDPAESIHDAKDYTFGVQYELGGEKIQETIEAIQTELGEKIELVEFANMQEQAEALHEENVDAIIYNEGYTDVIEELFEGYQDGIKIIYQYEIKTELDTSSQEVSTNQDTFSVYISGIDVYGDISKNSRSDVNIIATVNPTTHQILLTTTPRDYFVPIPGVSGGQNDKLTHAGIYGVDASMATLENLYETEIPFYARVNFTSVIEIVDLLGGIEVYSEYAFSNSDVTVQEGLNYFDGEEALAFCRERYSLPGGDNQRGKNQQAVIVAIMKKIMSPQILTNAASLINSVSDSVQTNMTEEQMQELIKTQLNEGGNWNVYSVAAIGKGGSATPYSMPGFTAYVMYPNEDSVNEIINLIDRVECGEVLTGSEEIQYQ